MSSNADAGEADSDDGSEIDHGSDSYSSHIVGKVMIVMHLTVRCRRVIELILSTRACPVSTQMFKHVALPARNASRRDH